MKETSSVAKVKELIGKDKIKAAIELLLSEAEQRNDNRLQREVLIQSAKHADYMSQQREGVVATDELERMKAKVRRALLDLATELQKTIDGRPTIARRIPGFAWGILLLVLILSMYLLTRQEIADRSEGLPGLISLDIKLVVDEGGLHTDGDGALMLIWRNQSFLSDPIQEEGTAHFPSLPGAAFSSEEGVDLKLAGTLEDYYDFLAPQEDVLLDQESVKRVRLKRKTFKHKPRPASPEQHGFSLQNLNGKVLCDDVPLVGAVVSIYMENKKMSGRTNENGMFTISVPKKANYNIQISHEKLSVPKEYTINADDGNWQVNIQTTE